MSLDKFTLADIPTIPKIHSIGEDKNLSEVLQLLVDNGIYSVPVNSLEGKFIGVVALDGVVAAIVKLFADKTPVSNKTASQRIAHHKFSKKEITDITYEFNQLKIKDANVIVYCQLVDTKTKIADAIKMIIETRQRLVVGAEEKIKNIISPYLLIKFLASHKELAVHAQKLKDTKAKISSPVQSITNDYNAISTFAKMIEKGFSGLAIVEEDTIITAITLKDVSFAAKDFSNFLEPVEDYVKNVRQAIIETTNYPTVNVADNDTIGVVCQKFIAVKSHRVFVRHDNQLYGILSVSDLLNAFI
jgi:CBS domain-containing protein